MRGNWYEYTEEKKEVLSTQHTRTIREGHRKETLQHLQFDPWKAELPERFIISE